MARSNLVFVLFVMAPALAGVATAQQPPIPVRSLSAATATTTRSMASIMEMHELPGGRLLVNDTVTKRLLVLDAGFSATTVVADTTLAGGRRYPQGVPYLIDYLADSTLLIDPQSRTLLVIEPTAAIGRVMAPPKPQSVNQMLNFRRGGVDARGNLLFQTGVTTLQGIDPLFRYEGQPVIEMPNPPLPSLAAILRADFDTRKLDTVAKFEFKRMFPSRALLTAAGKLVSAKETIHPLGQEVDDWAVTSDGSVAVVRGHDYHVDWYLPDGTKESSPKLPFDWRRLTDAEKQQMSDATHHTLDSLKALGYVTSMRQCDGDITYLSAYDAARGRISAADPDPAGCKTVPATLEFEPVAQMPDYLPPIRYGGMIADRDNNFWILPTTSLAAASGGGVVYDVVSRAKGLFERVRIPADRQIAGFGRNGTVFLKWHDPAGGGWLLERRSVVRP